MKEDNVISIEGKEQTFHADGETVLEVAKIMEAALEEEAPFIMTITNDQGKHQQSVSREAFLEHYLGWAMETLYEHVQVDEE